METLRADSASTSRFFASSAPSRDTSTWRVTDTFISMLPLSDMPHRVPCTEPMGISSPSRTIKRQEVMA
jgi:hypothetical protein